METNLNKIKIMAPKMENENWKFRTFIKGYENTEKLDAIVHRFHQK